MLVASTLDFITGSVFGATVAMVSAYIVMRRWSLADLRRVMDVARCVAGDVARRAVASLVPEASERTTLDLKPGVVPPLGDRPTRVYPRRPRVEVRTVQSDTPVPDPVRDALAEIERPA